MQWIVPVTLVPGIALIVLSTSNFVISLNREITELNNNKDKYQEIISLKLIQLRRLNLALLMLYIGIFFFLTSGILGAITEPVTIYSTAGMIAGILVLLIGMIILIIYGFKSIYIREKHLKL